MERGTVFFALGRALTNVAVWVAVCLISGCSNNVNDSPMTDPSTLNQTSRLDKHGIPKIMQVNLVADVGEFSATRIDGDLRNAWGIAQTPTGRIWISANHSGVSVIYDQEGNSLRAPVTIPTRDSSHGGAPTGVIFNPTTGFVIPRTGAMSRFIFSGEDGIISAWSSGASAIVVADRSSADAVYKGLTLANDGGRFYIYAANFKGGKVDVFDDKFQYDSTKTFVDAAIPTGFAPFNIQSIEGNLFVTYAKQKGPDNEDDEAAPGNGYVDIFRPNGTFVERFASQGTLNSPWGVTEGPRHGVKSLKDKILIGNFGDGRINIFDRHGRFIGQISDSSGSNISIPGLWGLVFSPEEDGKEPVKGGGEHHEVDAVSRRDSTRLFFTAGPNEENNGLFGYLKIVKEHEGTDSTSHDDGDEDEDSDDR